MSIEGIDEIMAPTIHNPSTASEGKCTHGLSLNHACDYCNRATWREILKARRDELRARIEAVSAGASEREAGTDFDSWWKGSGWSFEYRSIAESAWDAAIASRPTPGDKV